MSTRKYELYMVFGAIFIVMFQCGCSGQNESDNPSDAWPVLNGEYLGQEPPGQIPEIFGEGLISNSGNHEFGVTLTPDGNEFYFTRREPGQLNKLYLTRNVNGTWSNLEQVMSQVPRASEGHVSPDGQRLFFGTPEALYVALRSGNSWATPDVIKRGMYITATTEGTIYYTNITDNPPFIVKKTLTNGSYSEELVVAIEATENANVTHPFISPEEDYLIVNISGDFYISTEKQNGTWLAPRRLNDQINSPDYEFAPYVSPDGKYFFFSRGGANRTDIYWVDAQVLFG